MKPIGPSSVKSRTETNAASDEGAVTSLCPVHQVLSVWLPSGRMARAAAAMGAKAGDIVELTIRGELNDGRLPRATGTVTLSDARWELIEIE